MRVLARLLDLFPIRSARRAPAESSASRSAVDSLPPVIGPDDWRYLALIDRSMAWYFDRH